MADSQSSKTHLLFSLGGALYGVDAGIVYEVVWLPEITNVPDAPQYIAGVFNFGGRIIPVLDLSEWLGLEPQPYRLSDSVVILLEEDRWLGILVNEIHDVYSGTPEELLAGFAEKDAPNRILRAATEVDGKLVLLPDHHRLIQYAEPLQGLTEANLRPLPETALPDREREIFRERARSLALKTDWQEIPGLIQVAIIKLNGEHFGVKVECVREFFRARNITPVPCCPDHILGNVNLRGEVLTVIDIRGILKMPLAKIESESTIMVAEAGGSLVGIAIDEAADIASLHPAQITAVPLAAAGAVGNDFLAGAAPYGKSVVTILDLAKILASEELIVNEEV